MVPNKDRPQRTEEAVLINPRDGENGGGRKTSQMEDAVGVQREAAGCSVSDVLEFPQNICVWLAKHLRVH